MMMMMMCWNFFCVMTLVVYSWHYLACRSLLEGFFPPPQPHCHQTHIYTQTHTCLPKLLLENTIQASCETLIVLLQRPTVVCNLRLCIYIMTTANLHSFFVCVFFFYTPKCFGYPDTQMRGGATRMAPPPPPPPKYVEEEQHLHCDAKPRCDE